MLIPKFVKGDLVQISKDIDDDECKGCKAIVLYDDTGHANEGETRVKYGLLLREYGAHQAWFNESILSMIEPRRIDLISKFKIERDENHKKGNAEIRRKNQEFMLQLMAESVEECKEKGLDLSEVGKIYDKKWDEHLENMFNNAFMDSEDDE